MTWDKWPTPVVEAWTEVLKSCLSELFKAGAFTFKPDGPPYVSVPCTMVVETSHGSFQVTHKKPVCKCCGKEHTGE